MFCCVCWKKIRIYAGFSLFIYFFIPIIEILNKQGRCPNLPDSLTEPFSTSILNACEQGMPRHDYTDTKAAGSLCNNFYWPNRAVIIDRVQLCTDLSFIAYTILIQR